MHKLILNGVTIRAQDLSDLDFTQEAGDFEVEQSQNGSNVKDVPPPVEPPRTYQDWMEYLGEPEVDPVVPANILDAYNEAQS